eukprot:Cvel_29810.t1-p1 / transcript=Cvel_29810.t1 / gene=Cvel_29810 / organism=Chromera_velia_CCMP2878 / gene_product=hypothetical protein / transcript_product=hypothetical protein / location=Cvel_scaffold4149:4665-4867(+) / protein_length=67 / sequence_SO=supercontig / SO=protein_coding / is_pseudo=false
MRGWCCPSEDAEKRGGGHRAPPEKIGNGAGTVRPQRGSDSEKARGRCYPKEDRKGARGRCGPKEDLK